VPILGYDLDRLNHKLLVNENEAALVREISYTCTKEKSLITTAPSLMRRALETSGIPLKQAEPSAVQNPRIQICS